MLVNDIDPIRKKIIIKISNYEKTVNFSGLKIRQELLAHAKFEFFWRISDKIATEPSEDFDSFKKFFGMEVMFSFFNFVTQKEMLFKGLIDGMEIQNRDGASAGFLVKGHSHTIAMEDLKHSRQHLDKSLKDIFTDSLKGHTLGMWEPEDIAPAYKERIPSSLQSNEHSWKYLARLAKNYGEWLYWDGTRLQLGRLKDSKMTLINGIHLKSFGMGSKLLSNKSSFSGYDYNTGSQIQGQLEKTEDSFNDSLMNTSLNAQKLHYIRKMDSDIPFHSYSLNAQNQGDIDRMNKLDVAGKAAMMVTYSVESHVPVYVGHIVTVKNKAVDHVMIVTKSEITSIGVGNLVCKFEAIPADAKHPPYTNSEKHGKAKAQPALVLDNNDPAGMGRVRVKYFWGKSNNESDWLRVQTVHGGSGKGFYFIPEIGEEVRVCFEGGNPDRSFVSGSNFNGKEISGYSDSGNNVKAIHTRSGTKILLNDGEGSVFIEDASGNIVHLDGRGNVKVTAPKTMTLNATDLNINVSDSFNIAVGNQMTTAVMQKILLNTPFMQQLIADYYHLQSGKALMNSMQEMKLESPEMYVAGQHKLMMHSDESAILNSQGSVEMKGKSGNKLSNSPTSYEIVKEEIDAKCIVHFRPKNGWLGEDYGFDWMRLADTNLITGSTPLFGDVNYETIVSKQYTTSSYTTLETDINAFGGSFKADAALYSSLKNDYSPQIIPWKAKKDVAGADLKDAAGVIIPEDYFCAWLSLYPSIVESEEEDTNPSLKPGKKTKITSPTGYKNTKAVISLIIDIEEEPDVLEFEDNEHFKITPKQITVTGKGKGKHAFADHVTIECLTESNKDEMIVINAIKKQPAGDVKTVAGKIKVWANDASKRKTKKAVIVNIKTNVNGTGTSKIGNSTGQKELFEKYLHQALIEMDVDVVLLDVSADPKFMAGGHYVNGGQIAAYYRGGSIPAGFVTLEDYLYDKLKAQLKAANPADEHKYDNCFRAYYLGENGGYMKAGVLQGLNGYSSGNSVVLFPSKNDQTAAHEFLHSFNLPHSFTNKEADPDALFTYQYAETENLLDYSHRIQKTRSSLWHWQWIKANSSIV